MKNPNADNQSHSDSYITELVHSVRPNGGPGASNLNQDKGMLMKHISESSSIQATPNSSTRWPFWLRPLRPRLALSISLGAAVTATGLAIVQGGPGVGFLDSSFASGSSETVTPTPGELEPGNPPPKPQDIGTESLVSYHCYADDGLVSEDLGPDEEGPTNFFIVETSNSNAVEACQERYTANGFEVPTDLKAYQDVDGTIVVAPGEPNDLLTLELIPEEKAKNLAVADADAAARAVAAFEDDPGCETYEEATERLRAELNGVGLGEWTIEFQETTTLDGGDNPPDGVTACAGVSGGPDIVDRVITLEAEIGREGSGDLMISLNELLRSEDCLLGSDAVAWAETQLGTYGLEGWIIHLSANDDVRPEDRVVPDKLASLCVSEVLVLPDDETLDLLFTDVPGEITP